MGLLREQSVWDLRQTSASTAAFTVLLKRLPSKQQQKSWLPVPELLLLKLQRLGERSICMLCVDVHVLVHTLTCVYIYMYTNLRVNMYTYIYMYTYTDTECVYTDTKYGSA